MKSQARLSILLVFWPGLALADFIPDDQIVSDPTAELPQPEFDRATNRIIWQDRHNRLWVGQVDPVTGDLVPTNGRGQLVDTGLGPPNQVGNTPRYTYGGDQDAIVYTKLVDGHLHLAKALEVAPNTWQITLLENGEDRWHANGTPEETTGPAMIVYNQVGPVGTLLSWRELDNPDSEHTVDAAPAGGRFLGAEPALMALARDNDGIMQVFEIPFATGEPEQVTFGRPKKQSAFIWWAPEYQDYVFTVMQISNLAFYRRSDGVWRKFNQFVIPNGKPYVSSPEAFVINDTSYIAVVSCDVVDFQVWQPRGPSEVWVTGIDPAHPFFRRIDDPSYAAVRMEPEPYVLDGEAVVYYTEMGGRIHLVKRAKTGITRIGGLEDMAGLTASEWSAGRVQ